MKFLGRIYDKNGNLVNWWSNSSTDSFNNKSQCFVDQYNEIGVNGFTNKVRFLQ